MGKNNVINSVCRSRKMWMISFRPTDRRRCKEKLADIEGSLAKQTSLFETGLHGSIAIGLRPRQCDEHVLQAWLGWLDVDIIQPQFGEATVGIDQRVDRVAKDGGLVHTVAMTKSL
jgi:hypothetical protein